MRLNFCHSSGDILVANKEILDELLQRGTVRDGDLVLITKGDQRGIHGGTNLMKILQVGDPSKVPPDTH